VNSLNDRISTSTLKRRFQDEDGFSLMELLVVMVVMVVVLGAIYAVWFGLQRTYSFTDEDMKAQSEARAALAEMVEVIRTARQPETAASEDLEMVIVSADSNALVCWTDIDRDPTHDLELVRFRVDTGSRTLYRDVSQAGDPTFGEGTSVRLVGNWLANDDSTPLFSFRSSNGSELSTPVTAPMSIGEVEINLRIDIEVGKSPIAHHLSSVVQPRNLRQY